MITLKCLNCNKETPIALGINVDVRCGQCGPRTFRLLSSQLNEVTLQCPTCGETTLLPTNTPKSYRCPNKKCRTPYIVKFLMGGVVTAHTEHDKVPPIKKSPANINTASAIVLCHDRLKITQQCIARIRKLNPRVSEIVLVDNGSADNVQQWAMKQDDIIYVRNRINLGCAIGRNQGAAWASGTWLLFLDNDQLVPKDLLAQMLKLGGDIIGVEHWQAQPSGRTKHVPEDPLSTTSYLGAGGMLIRKQVFRALNGFDERYAPAWYADSDFSMRAKLYGYKMHYLYNANVEHRRGQTVNSQKSYDSNKEKAVSCALFGDIWSEYLFRGGQPRAAKPPKANFNHRPRILMLADVQGWAWWNKSLYVQKYLADEFEIDIVIDSQPISKDYDCYFTFLPSQLRQLNGIPPHKIITGVTASPGLKKWIKSGSLDAYKKRVAALHANSRMLFEELTPYHRHRYYLPNGVDTELFTPWELPNQKRLVLGFVGRPDKTDAKGLVSIIKAAADEAEVDLKTNVNLYSNRDKLNTMPSFYAGIDVYCVASTMDGTPNPMLEAAACGRPIIANRIGNAPEFVRNGINGFLVDRKVSQYVTKIRYFVKNRDKLKSMGNEARKTALEWDWETQANNYRAMFREVICRK